jgi:hypothetical protein
MLAERLDVSLRRYIILVSLVLERYVSHYEAALRQGWHSSQITPEISLGYFVAHVLCENPGRDPAARVIPFVAFWPPHEAGGSGLSPVSLPAYGFSRMRVTGSGAK